MKKLIPLIITLLLLGCKGKSVEIGVIVPLSGSIASYGKEVLKGVELALYDYNESKPKVKINLIIYDNKGFSKPTEEGVKKFVENDKCVAIIGPVVSKLAIKAANIAEKGKIPLITPTATHPYVTHDKNYIFRVCYTDPVQGEMMAKFAVEELGFKKAGVLYEANNPYSEGLFRKFSLLFEKLGGKIVVNEYYVEGDTAFTERLKKLKKTSPEIVFIPGYVEEVVHILKEAKKIGFTEPVFLGGDGWHSPFLIEKVGNLFERDIKAYFTSPFFPDMEKEKVKRFVEKYRNKYKEEPQAFAALAYDAMSIVLEAIKNLDNPTRERIFRYINELSGYEGVTGEISFEGRKDPSRDVYILKPTPSGFELYKKILSGNIGE